MFGRRNTDETPAETVEEPPKGKGRPTPTRREAEAARKQNLRVPKDPRAAKKAMRQREREERAKQRAALARGDEKALPPRDQGPVRAFTRNWVDSRRLFTEFFLPLAVVVLLASLVPVRDVQVIVAYAWYAMLLILVVDITVLVFRIKKALTEKFPDKDDRKGATFYGVMRALQIRRLRLPPPKVKAGGKPVPPKRR